jgi:hypothetical protein
MRLGFPPEGVSCFCGQSRVALKLLLVVIVQDGGHSVKACGRGLGSCGQENRATPCGDRGGDHDAKGRPRPNKPLILSS